MKASELNNLAYAKNNVPAGCMIDSAIDEARCIHPEGSAAFDEYVVEDIRSQLCWSPAPEAVKFFAELGIVA